MLSAPDYNANVGFHGSIQRTLAIGGRITVHLVSSLTKLDLTNEENMLFFNVVNQLNSNF